MLSVLIIWSGIAVFVTICDILDARRGFDNWASNNFPNLYLGE